MDEKDYLRVAAEAEAEIATWRTHIEKENYESKIRIQDFMTEIELEKQASSKRIDDYKSEIQRLQDKIQEHRQKAAEARRDEEQRKDFLKREMLKEGLREAAS